MTLTEASEIIRNIALTAAAPMGAVVAIRGLNTWQREKTWESDQALARKMAVALQRRQDAFRGLRNSLISAGEMIHAVRNDPNVGRSTEAIDDDHAWAIAMNARLEKLREAVLDYYGCQIEAEVVWGSEIGSLSKELGETEFKVQLALEEVSRERSKERDSYEAGDYRDYMIQNQKLAFGQKDDETDTAHAKTTEAIRSILKSKLKTRK